MKRNRNYPGGNTRLAVAFFICVFVFVGLSLIFRVGVIVANSHYSDASRFTISIENGKELRIMSIAGQSKSLSLLDIKGDIKGLNKSKFIGVPVDASVITSLEITEKTISDLMSELVLNYGKLKTDLTIIDMARIYMSVRSIPPVNIYFRSVSSSLDNENIRKVVSELFKDEEIEREKLTIRVVNSTNVNGLGARLGRLISNMGGNVVLIESGDKEIETSSVSYFGKKNYTVGKLERVLGFSTIKTDTKTIADIVITIGADSIDTDVF